MRDKALRETLSNTRGVHCTQTCPSMTLLRHAADVTSTPLYSGYVRVSIGSIPLPSGITEQAGPGAGGFGRTE